MPDLAWSVIPALLFATSLGGLPLVGRFARSPCPHCGKKAGRTARDNPAIPGIVSAHVTYVCDACGGVMRYARGPTGKEYWEPIAGPAGEGS